MKKRNPRIISLFISFFMVFSIIFSNPVNVFAYNEGAKSHDKINMLRKIVNENSKNKATETKIEDEKEQKTTFIIEIEDKAIKDYVGNKSLENAMKDRELVKKVLDSQKPYKEQIKRINKDARFKNEYVLLINGFSVEAKLGDMEKIKAIKGIKHISIAKEYFRDMNSALDLGRVKEIYKQYGYKGEGMVVSVIDSGIDYTHKDMVLSKEGKAKAKLTKEVVENIGKSNDKSKGKYFTEKIPYGYNFVDKNHEIIDKAIGNVGYMHGMHVAGIIGANCQESKEINNNNGIKGVAPEAQLLAMKIFSNNPQINNACESDVISAIEDSVAHGADVINMSISGSAGFQDPEDGQQKAIREAVKRGVMVIVAGGNAYYSTYPNKYEGVVDTGVIGAPGLEHDSIQVASINNSITTSFVLNYKAGVEDGKMPYGMTDFDIRKLTGEYQIVDCGLGRVVKESNIDDFKDKDLKGKIALIKRGEGEFKDKKINAQERGAVAVIIYNVDKDDTILDSTAFDKNVLIPSIFIKNSDGVKLKNLISKGLKVCFKNDLLKRESDGKGQMSEFSSWGPTSNLDLKPDLTGVGGTVWSTVNNNSYKSMSGTSMATPYTSGISALLVQHINSLNLNFKNDLREKVKFIKALMMNTAEVQRDEKHNVPYSPRRQGAGFVNAENALKNKVVLTYKGEPAAALKVINKVTNIPMELKNYGSKSATYKIEAPFGVLTEVQKVSEEIPYDVKLKGADIKFDKDKITVGPGQTVKVNATLTLDGSVLKDIFVEGFIKFVSEDSENPSISIPYMGFYGDWAGKPILDNPNYTGKSLIGESTLVSATQSLVGYDIYFIGSGKNSDSENFAINPDDNYCINNALPQVTFLRNAKKLKIDVTDEKNNVIRVIQEKSNVKKDVFAEQSLKAKIDYGWLWDGKVYNKDLGEKVSVENGQYYINMRVLADIENAKEQVITFPVKVDKIAPKFKVPNLVITESSDCNLQLEASDGKKSSGISGFVFVVNDKDYVDEKGNKMFKPKEDTNNKYNMKLKLPQNSNPLYKVFMGCTDYAKNLTPQETLIVDSSKSKLNLKLQKKSYKPDESIDLKYTLSDASKAAVIDHYEVFIDDTNKSINNKQNDSYVINDKLKGGEHFILVKAVDNHGEIVDANAIKFNVEGAEEPEKPNLEGIQIENLTKNQVYYKGSNANIKIKASNFTKEQKDVVLMIGVYNEKEMLVNTSIVSKIIKPETNTVFETSIRIPKEGNHKIKVFVLDNLDNIVPYIDAIEINPVVQGF